MNNNILIIIFLLFFALHANSQEEIVTDRPDITESALVVPHKTLQIEYGAYSQIEGNFNTYSPASALLRIGLLKKHELRLFYENFSVRNTLTDVTNANQSTYSIGFKSQLLKEKSIFDGVALIVGYDFQYQNNKFSKKNDLNATLAAEHSILNVLGLSYNFGVNVLGNNIKDINYSLALGFPVVGELGGFVEIFGNMDDSKNFNSQYVDGGLTYLLKPNFQLDLSAGYLLKTNVQVIDNSFISAGFSWRIPK
jgi:hypothetical protein